MRRVPHRARRLVGERSRGQCERCGQRKPLQMSHRIPRGMGGSVIGQDNPALYCHLCDSCHRWVESSLNDAIYTGYKVERGMDPALTPVETWYGWHYFTEKGGSIAWLPHTE